MSSIVFAALLMSIIANFGQYIFAMQLDRRRQVADANVDHAIVELGKAKRKTLKLQTELSSVRAELERSLRRMSSIEARILKIADEE